MPQNSKSPKHSWSKCLKLKYFKKFGIMRAYRVQTKRHFAKTHLSKQASRVVETR